MTRPVWQCSEPGLEQLGWSDGRNVRIDYRWSAGEPERIRRNVAELVALAPDVILCSGGTVAIATLQRAARNVPIVFTGIDDPVGSGLVESLAHPGGNTTGFMVGRIRLRREMAGAAQGDRAGRETSGSHAGCRQPLPAVASSPEFNRVAPSLGVELSPDRRA